MFRKTIGIIGLCIVMVSCGTKRRATKIEDAATAKIINNHEASLPDFKTLNGRLKIKYQDENTSQGMGVSFRMKKDSAIWISAQVLGIPLAKALITKKRVSYYEKIGKTYFDGDFSLVNKWLGTPLDYEKLQNLLLGQAVYNLRDDNYKLTESTRGYQLKPSNELEAIKKMFLIDPQNYRAMAQQLTQEKENRGVTVTYSGYQSIDQQLFPEEIHIIANEKGHGTQIDIDFRSIDLNSPVSFPFNIPDGYDKIEVE